MGLIDADTLMPLQAWCLYRPEQRRRLLAHARARTLRLGPHWQLQFDDELTVRLEVQAQRLQGLDGPSPNWTSRVPDGTEWRATLRLVGAEVAPSPALLALLHAALPQLYVEVERWPRAYAQWLNEPSAGASGAQPPAPCLLRFALSHECREAVLSHQAVRLGCAHPSYHWRRNLPPHLLQRLRRDLVLPGRIAPAPAWPGTPPTVTPTLRTCHAC